MRPFAATPKSRPVEGRVTDRRSAPPRRDDTGPSVSAIDPEARHALGRIDGDEPGPLVVVFCGIHGNEPAGVQALRRVFTRLRSDGIAVRGTLVGILGNVSACEKGVRFVDSDLNRLWTAERVERLRNTPLEDCLIVEERELWELIRIVDRLLDDAPDEPTPVFIDLHTASAGGAPFAIASNTLDHMSLFRGLPIPILAGLEEQLSGLALQYLVTRDARTLAVEAGPHESEAAVEQLEDVLWLLLASSGAVDRDAVPDRRGRQRRLRALTRGLPPIVEVIHRHAVEERAAFEMTEGFQSFDMVDPGTRLATHHGQSVLAGRRARLLMPLYQERGEDGFFLGLDRDRPYLVLSAWFRRLRLEWILRLFPQVRPAEEYGDAWRVDRPERPWVREALRFFGYRDQRPLRDGSIIAKREKR